MKDGDEWISILGSNPDYSPLNFWSRDKIYSIPSSYKKRTKKKLYYDLENDKLSLNIDYCLEEDNILHIRYRMSNKKTLHLSKILLSYAILLGSDPDYTWSPHLRPKENYVIGDHVYRSPAIIYKKGKLSFAFIPDLKTLGQNRPYKSFLDFDLRPKNFRGSPQVAYGFGNYKQTGHIYFKHKPNKKWKIKKNTDLTFRYYIIIFKDKKPQEILEFINKFLWDKYGNKLLNGSLAPQVIPYDKNAEEGFKAIIERHKLWGDITLNGKECGGSWQTSWMGKRKSKIAFMSPEGYSLKKMQKKNITALVGKESLLSRIILHFVNSPWWHKRFDKFTRTIPIVQRNAEIWFNAWFNNMRTAYGFRYFGELWNDSDLIDKGNRILNSVLYSPTIRGISPSVIMPASLGETTITTINGLLGFLYVEDYCVVDCSITTYWALKFCQDFNHQKEEVKQKASNLIDLLTEVQYDSGEIPAYLNFESDEKTPIISEILHKSASSGAPLMLLTEYYNVFKDDRIIPIAEKIAKYLQTEIIPEDKWHDFEPFYSCTHAELDFYCDHTKKHAMNGLCIYWCAEGMKQLYKITKKEEYLRSGERILAILSLFQQVWDAPYISFNTFGGFCSQNIDAELSDARQGLFIHTYMEYYLLTGKKEYMERGIAALRGSWAMQILKEYEEQCPGNLDRLSTVDTVDRGIVAENYGHTGTDLRIPGYWMPDWGCGSSIMATAYSKRYFGDVFIDFKEKLVFGIDGILIKNFNIENLKVSIEAEIIQNKSYVIFMGREPPSDGFKIILNGKSLGKNSTDEINKGFKIELD